MTLPVRGRQFRHALRNGAFAWLIAVLALALVAAPKVATALDYGHHHPADTPAHVHAISGVLIGIPAATPVSPAAPALAFVVAVWLACPTVRPRKTVGHPEPRAPPQFVS